ncbi:hypothetical protein, partial [Gaoshiqia sediminis]
LFGYYVKFICIFKLFQQLTTSVRAAYAGRTHFVYLTVGAVVISARLLASIWCVCGLEILTKTTAKHTISR